MTRLALLAELVALVAVVGGWAWLLRVGAAAARRHGTVADRVRTWGVGGDLTTNDGHNGKGPALVRQRPARERTR